MIRWRASRRSTSRISWASVSSSTVQAGHDSALFDRPEIGALLQEHLGFTFRDFTTVRSAIQERYNRIITGLRNETGDIAMRCQAEGRDPTVQEIQAFRKSMSAFMVLPGERASFTVSVSQNMASARSPAANCAPLARRPFRRTDE